MFHSGTDVCAPQSDGAFFSGDEGEEKCAPLLPPWCDVAPGAAKSSLSLKDRETETAISFRETVSPVERGGKHTRARAHTFIPYNVFMVVQK